MAMVMAVMMSPFLVEPLAIVRHRSLRRRRLGAAAEFSVTYVAAWFVISLAFLAVLRPAAQLWQSSYEFVLACVVLAGWQVSDLRSRVASRCRRIRCPPPAGWRSHLGTLAEGGHEAASCIRTSGGPMLLMAMAPAAGLMVVVWAIHLWEWRPGRDPFVEPRALGPAFAYAVLAASTLGASLLA